VQLVVAVALGLIVGILLILLISGGKSPAAKKQEKPAGSPSLRRCPLCHAPLSGTERVHSVVYPGKPDGMMHIFGCPYCSGPKDTSQRQCPVCNAWLTGDDYVIARVFDRSTRMHVHVLGCTRCRRGFGHKP
jgi:uncharacterized protein with PIN domain